MPPDLAFIAATLARRGLAAPGRPDRLIGQLNALRRWGFGLPGELRSAAARFPDRVALIDEQGSLNYRDLLRRTERLARALRGTYGIQPGDRVGMLCRNHTPMIEIMIAVATLGADPVLVNTGLSGAQLAAVAIEQRLKLLVHDSEFAATAAAVRPVARLDPAQVDSLIEQGSPGAPLRPPSRAGRTIVLTSGTTGAPKGARRPAPPGFGPLVAIISRIPVDAGSRILIAAPLFHTWGYAALQLTLALRGTAVLQRRFDASGTLRAVREHRCDALFAVPVMLQRILETEPAPTPLRVVAVSGSALPGRLATRFMDTCGDVLYNLYGSTEASWASIATPEELRAAPGTAGRPPHGTRVEIRDPHDQALPPGRTGRIFVGNSMLFDGYTSGGSGEQPEGLIRTGDLGHFDEHGLLFVDGREDDMVISGGENIFPSQVEDLLAQLPQVREAAVVGVPDREYGQRLAAYLVLHPGERLDADAVREYVRHYLARFAVPRDVRFLAELPRNATGKIVRRDLPG